ncbi:MAG: outer membrane protein assembly factor BamB [Limisphaerales bacterium]|jgi:outer membrane protein assembly factor BamB
MHLHDAARSGFTEERIEFPLAREWVHSSPAAPRAAWAPPIPHVVEGNLEVDRMDFDKAYQVVANDESVYFGSSSDDQVYCLDLASGQVRWTFFTGGPVRLAPTLAKGRLYFGSDDGFAYCLAAKTGDVIWRQMPGFNERKHLGNGRLISRWPLRTAVLVKDGIAYCGAGVFPHEGIILSAFDAETGRVIWKNDSLGEQNSNRSRLAPQGYLLANEEFLYVPSGRDLPAGFNIKDGKLRFQSSTSWRASGIVGGTYAVLVDGQLITGANQNVAFDARTGRVGEGWFDGRRMVVRGGISYLAKSDAVVAVDRASYAAGSRKLLEMRKRHDGRDKEDPQYLSAVSRSLLREEQAKRKSQQDPARITKLKQDIVRHTAIVRGLQMEEAEFEKDYKAKATKWSVSVAASDSLIGTPDAIFAGGDGLVVGINTDSGARQWEAKIDGNAAGMAITAGRLLVTTDTGQIYCFQPGNKDRPQHKVSRPDFAALAEPELSRVRKLTDRILQSTQDRRGYCLVLGLTSGQLAWEISNRTEMKVIAMDEDPAVVDRVRRALAAAGRYGTHLHLLAGTADQLPNYFANIIVSEKPLVGKMPASADVSRMLRPLGGKALIGLPSAADSKLSVMKVKAWLAGLTLESVDLAADGAPFGFATRGALPGAGSWTHQYGNSGNTSFSEESRLTAPLGVLWYGDPGPTQMINRHSQGTPPVSLDGRMFIVGDNVIFGYDSYNGTKLWEADYQGRSRTRTRSIPGNLVATQRGVFLATQDRAMQFHPRTGKLLHEFVIPDDIKTRNSSWSYLGIYEGILVGSVTESLLPANTRYSSALFAYDIKSGRLLWTYKGDKIAQMTIALGDWRAFFVDSRMTTAQLEAALSKDRTALAKLKGEARQKAELKIKDADRRLAVSLNLETGKRVWSEVLDLTDCTGISRAHGELMTMYQNGLLIFAGASGNGHYWDQFISGEFKDRKLKVVDAVTGKEIWSKEANYRIRPLINGDTIIAEPWGFDLYTGKQKERTHPTTGKKSPWQFIRSGHHCGHVAATENLLFFRSASTAYYDLKNDTGVSHFSGIRTGCTINMIPANGLVHIPEASAGCQCLFAIQSTVTMEPVGEDRAWSIFTTPGPTLPVERMHVNFGAPGDRRDGAGNLWLAYPRPQTSSRTRALELELDFEIEGNRPTTYQRLTETQKITSTANPWIHSSGYESATQISVPVLGSDDKPGVYNVRLHFAELDEVADRSFDIALQEEIRLRGFNIRKTAGATHQAVTHEISGVDIFDWLEISLRPKNGNRPPLISGLELIRVADSSKPRPVSLRYPPAWPKSAKTISLKATADASVGAKYPDRNEGASTILGMDGGAGAMQDESYSMLFLKFDLSKIPGKPLAAKLRLKCLGPGSQDAGNVYVVSTDWKESEITYSNKPGPKRRIAKIGLVKPKETIERTLVLGAGTNGEFSILIRPTSTDGIRYGSSESKDFPELIVAYE